MPTAKYLGLIERSFKTKLELYLFNELINKRHLNELNEEGFINFIITDQMIKLYEKAWQMEEAEIIEGIQISQIDQDIEGWNKSNTDDKASFLMLYVDIFKRIFPMSDFKEFYDVGHEERKCFYCGISEKDISLLKKNGVIKTKRNRGKQMEIDRRNSKKEYTLDNVILACYWCNNAKSDEFTADEYKVIAEGIKRIWEQRLKEVSIA